LGRYLGFFGGRILQFIPFCPRYQKKKGKRPKLPNNVLIHGFVSESVPDGKEAFNILFYA